MTARPLARTLARFAVLTAIALLAYSSHAGVYSNWTYRSQITFTGYNRQEELRAFPVAVLLGTNISSFAYAQLESAGGGDLRFAAADDATELNYEVELWDTNGTSIVWVQVPALSNASDFIWAYWGLSGTNAPPCTTNGVVWSNSFEAVWHLAETNSPARDSTRRGYDATASGGPNLAGAGIVDGGDAFDGVNDALGCGAKPGTVISDPTGRDVTFACWLKPDNHAQNGYVFSSGGQTSSRGLGIYVSAFERVGLGLRTATNYVSLTDYVPVGYGAWAHFALTYRADSGLMTLYLNGTNFATASAVPLTSSDSQTSVYLGRPNSVANYYYAGALDEVRFETAARSSNWIWACWMNQASNAVFCSYGAAGAVPGGTQPAVLTQPPTAIGVTTATLRGLVTETGGGGDPAVFFCLDTEDRGATATSDWARVIGLGSGWAAGVQFSTNVDGLASDASYAYRCYVTNAAGSAFSPYAETFDTIGLPAVINRGAAELRFTEARVAGTVTDTGQSAPAVKVLYWQTAGSPTGEVEAGVQSGAFSTRLAGLAPGIAYSFLFTASNEAGAAASATAGFTNPAPADWHARTRIALPGYDKAETLTNFPLLVCLATNIIPGFDYGQFLSGANADLRFTDGGDWNELDYEIERWTTTGVSHVWVKIPALRAGGEIRALWGNPAATRPVYSTNGSVWADGFEAVWHLSETSGSHADATLRGYTAMPAGGVTQGSAGLIGGADVFNGTSGYLTCGNHPSSVITDPTGSDITYSSWLRPNDAVDWTYAFSSGGQVGRGLSFRLSSTEMARFIIRDDTYSADSGDVLPVGYGNWVLVTAVYDRNAGGLSLYRNGTVFGSYARTNATYESLFAGINLGMPNNVNQYHFTGSIDETRVETAARSSNWVWACWFSQSSNGLFCAYSPVQPPEPAVMILIR